MSSSAPTKFLEAKVCEGARRSRDARFDGLFFTAVKTTGIYCRPICPASPPLEKNVEYHHTAVSAAKAGFRPCLRCRPDSSPQSCAWLGTQTTFQRALSLIQEGALQSESIEQLALRLGISDRYLRELFQQNLGTSPKKFALYQQCLFAKQLLHESSLPVTEVAFAAGFKSVRRFNEAMQEQIGLSPTQVRKQEPITTGDLSLKLHYRPPYAWQHCFDFLQRRLIPQLEWVTNGSYHRTIAYKETKGVFCVKNVGDKNHLLLSIKLDGYHHLNAITQKIRNLFDVDAPVAEIDAQLQHKIELPAPYLEGLRIPGIWSTFEAGIRAILGQQVTVLQAMKLVTLFVEQLGESFTLDNGETRKIFPQPEKVLQSDLAFFRMPQSRKDTILRLAKHFQQAQDPDNLDEWLKIKGIGPWTVNYVKIRAGKNPDIWLAGDAGVNNALKLLDKSLDIEATKPWRSYLTFQLWHQLAQANN